MALLAGLQLQACKAANQPPMAKLLSNFLLWMEAAMLLKVEVWQKNFPMLWCLWKHIWAQLAWKISRMKLTRSWQAEGLLAKG